MEMSQQHYVPVFRRIEGALGDIPSLACAAPRVDDARRAPEPPAGNPTTPADGTTAPSVARSHAGQKTTGSHPKSSDYFNRRHPAQQGNGRRNTRRTRVSHHPPQPAVIDETRRHPTRPGPGSPRTSSTRSGQQSLLKVGPLTKEISSPAPRRPSPTFQRAPTTPSLSPSPPGLLASTSLSAAPASALPAPISRTATSSHCTK